jgi:hypothetical protein
MDYIFLLQCSIIFLVWRFSSWFYKYSEWLFYNKYVEIDTSNYPRAILFLINQFNKEGIFYYFFLTVIIIPIGLAGLFICGMLIKGGFTEFELFLYSSNWWEQVLTFIFLILFYYLIRICWDGRKRTLFFIPKYNNNSLRSVRQNIKDVDKYKIQTYPRLTIYDLNTGEDKDDQLIFDSVSFSRINRILGVYDKRFKTTLSNNEEIELENLQYSITNLEIDFLSEFKYFIIRRTDEKISEIDNPNVPYNIHIIIEAKRIQT